MLKSMRITRKFLLLMALIAVSIISVAQEKDDLQEFINSANSGALTRADNVTVVDLSQFSATTRKTTLTISTGGSFLFVNGTLSRAESLDTTLISITNGSSVELGNDCIISGGGFCNYRTLIHVNDGLLKVSTGEIKDNVVDMRITAGGIQYSQTCDTPILLSNDKDQFIMTGGSILGQVECNAKLANVEILGGTISRASGAMNNMSIVSQSSISLSGNADVSNIKMVGAQPIFLTSAFTHRVNLYYYVSDIYEGLAILKGKGYEISEQDVDSISGYQISFTDPMVHPKRQIISLLSYNMKLIDNQVYLIKSHILDNIDDLQKKLNEIAAKGTATFAHPDTIVIAEKGVLVDKYLYVPEKCHAVLTGGPIRVSPQANCDYYPINILEGGSLKLEDLTVDLMNNGFDLHKAIFFISGHLTIGGWKNIEFQSIPQNKGANGECIFYVSKMGELGLGSCNIEIHGDLPIVYSADNGYVSVYSKNHLFCKSAPVIEGKGDVSVSSGYIRGGYSTPFIVAKHFGCKATEIIFESPLPLEIDTCYATRASESQYSNTVIVADTAEFAGGYVFKGNGQNVVIKKMARFYDGSIHIPDLHIDNPETFECFELMSKLTTNAGWRIFTKDWTKMKLGKSIVKGVFDYVLTEDDFNKIKFLNLPENIEAYLDETDNSVKLRQKASADDLQDFINEQSGNVITVDLSKFSAITRNKTLEIRTGKYYKFVNGTLKKAADCTEPLITISNGSSVEIGSIDNSNDTRAWVTANGVINGVETIRMEGGSLTVLGGVLDGGYTWNSEDYDNAVLMTSDVDKLILAKKEGAYGWVSGPIVCNASKAYISIDCNGMHTNTADFGTVKSFSDVIVSGDMWMHIELLGKANVVKLTSALKRSMEIKAMERTYDDTIMEGYDFQLSSDPNIKNFKYIDFKGNKEYQLRLENNKVVLGIDDLQDFIDNPGEGNGTGTEDDPIKGNIGCDGVDVNDDLKFKDDLQYFITGQQAEDADCQGTIRQNEGDVTIPTGSTVTYTYLYLHGCGCQKYIYVYGTLIIDYNIYIYNYLRFIYLRPGGRIIIRGLNGEVADEIFYVEGGTVEYRGGNSAGGKYGWWNNGGTVYIYDGTIKGGTCGGYTGANGVSYIYGGTVEGGIHNYGTTYIYGGVITGGSGHTIYNYQGGIVYVYGGTCDGPGTIWNQGTIYIDGCNTININEIHVILGCRIYIINKLTYLLRLNITVENIVLDTPIILGGNGYILTAEDCRNLQITLPEGYGWRYDEASCGIVIYSTSGIADVTTDHSAVNSSYDVSGRKIRPGSKGLNIQRMKDGSVRKVMNQ